MACVLSWERKQACLLVDLHHACLVMFNAHKKQAEQPHSWLLAQMIGEVLSYLMIPSAFISPVTLSGGRSHTCVIDATGHLHCFGYNREGQCDVPAQLGMVTQVAAGYLHTCVIRCNRPLALLWLQPRGSMRRSCPAWNGDAGCCRISPYLCHKMQQATCTALVTTAKANATFLPSLEW
eukprot:TRINITY_DN26501_c0_g1_i4.p1 TRINITY_DN26501_c0_g1~~TRINITY_DN26501_c0_g1_i4.p1  ORF type:complete len:179 (-),score=17.60 TRINITY_DN26501_c0_g1_i4:105-641(-)